MKMTTPDIETLYTLLGKRKAQNNKTGNGETHEEPPKVPLSEVAIDKVAVGDKVTVSYADKNQSKNPQGEYPSVTATYRIEESQPKVATKRSTIIKTRPIEDYLTISSIVDTSNLGMALLGKKVGDEVSVTVGGETTKYTIIKIEKTPLPPASN